MTVSETDDEIANEGVHAKTLILVLVLILPPSSRLRNMLTIS